MEKPLLILDIDETLVRAGDQLVRPPDFYAGDEFYGGYPVYKRPYLDQFLQKTSQLYKLAIWTSGGALYAAAIVAHIIPKDIPLEFVWSYERCGHFFDAEWRVRKPPSRLKRFAVRVTI